MNRVSQAILFAFPMMAIPAFAVEPYPSLPPTLSTAVTPNVLLHIDNSGSMRNVPNSSTSKSKMIIAKGVATNLVKDNASLRWGIFSFDGSNDDTGGLLRAEVGSSTDTLTTAISKLSAQTWTPLGEALFEINRYWSGQKSYYSSVNYSSPIKYRCQKNFNIVITDGVSTKDNELPGLSSTYPAESYQSFDSNGTKSTKSFKVCKDTSTVSSVSCPAKLEGSTVNNDFVGTSDDSASYGRAIRDVSAFMFDKDMRTSSDPVDGDGQSFDDPKFPRQNVTTYTIGFAINDVVLNAAAIVGGGEYYTAGDEDELALALKNAVSSIVASTSNAGGVATMSEVTTAGNKIFQPVFNPKGWYGELRCYTLDATQSNGIGTACSPNAKAVIPPTASRKIFSNRVGGLTTPAYDTATGKTGMFVATTPVATTTAFEFTDADANFNQLSAMQKALLSSDAAATATAAEKLTLQKNTVKYLRGVDTISGFRTRPNGLLGDIIDGQPTVVSAPSGQTPDPDYPAYKATYASRNLVFIGANDGMLHAFNIDKITSPATYENMTELMGYIPSAVYPRLRGLRSPDYGDSAGSPHAYHVNGSSRQADIKLNKAWTTLLVGSLGQGGQGYHAIDATSPNVLTTTSAVKWEWTDVNDPAMGYSFPTPLIYNVRDSETTAVPAVILANGYENAWDDKASGGQKVDSNSSALYILNANTGALIKRIDVPGGEGLSSPAGVDFGQDGVLDYVYAGDINGKLWRFDLTNSSDFKVNTTPIFIATSPSPGSPAQPITIRPAVKPVTGSDGKSIGNLVLFGTGKLLLDSDRSDTTIQSFYAVLDTMSKSPTTVSRSDLLARTVVDTKTVSSASDLNGGAAGGAYRAGDYRMISRTPTTSTEIDLTSKSSAWKGWRLDLPVSSERLVTSPLLVDDKLLFGTGIPLTTQKCVPGGSGWVMGLNPMTGSVTKSARGNEFSFVDVNNDSKSTSADKILFTSGGAAYASGFSKDGIPTELTYVAAASKIVTTSTTNSGLGDSGSVIAMKDSNMMAVYTGNAADGVKTGNPIGRPVPTGGGTIISGTVGNDKLGQDKSPPPSSGVKVEMTTWREIK